MAMTKTLRVVGIDPGVANMGVALLESAPSGIKVIETLSLKTAAPNSTSGGPALPDDGRRLLELEFSLSHLLKRSQPNCIAYETIFQGVGKAGQTTQAIRVGKAIGMIERLAFKSNIETFAYSPTTVLAAVRRLKHGGQPPENRAERKKWVKEVIGKAVDFDSTPWSHHESDAVAVAICHLWKCHFSYVEKLFKQTA